MTAFKPEQFLDVAKRLINEGSDEATLRTAISRAYYSAFLVVRERLGMTGFGHRKVWKDLDRIDSRFAVLGDRLRKLRNAADYGDHIPGLRAKAGFCVRGASVMLNRFK